MSDASEILSAALTLPEDERLSLASRLFASVAPIPPVLSDEDFRAELQQRWEDHEADPSTAISWNSIRNEMTVRRDARRKES